jgi:hypothetical protein
MKYINILSEEKSIVAYYNLMFGYMGKLSPNKATDVYNCLNQNPNFSKAFLMLSNMSFDGSSKGPVKKSHKFKSSYPAIFYLYGLGDVKQDYDKAYELFSYSEADIGSGSIPDHAYLAYMKYMGMGVEQNQNKGKGLTIELAKKVPITKTKENSWDLMLSCGGVNYNFIMPDLLALALEPIWKIKNYYKLSESEKEEKKKNMQKVRK